MEHVYVILLSDNADNFDIVQSYFTSKDKAIEWLESNGFEHLSDDTYSKEINFSIKQHAGIQILINSEDTNND